ncbi:MAG: helix-turn-helix domain-containing protein [Gaiellaceae bacterium]
MRTRDELFSLPVSSTRVGRLQTPYRSSVEGLLLDRKAAARSLGCSTKTVDRLRERGELAWVPLGRAVKFRPGALEEYISARERNSGGGEPVSKERQLAPVRVAGSRRGRAFVPPSLQELRQKRNGDG